MNNDTIVILAAAGIGLYLMSKMIKPGGIVTRPPSGSGTASSLNNNGSPPIVEIGNDDLPGQAGYGWKYYSDGTAISPQGEYYFQGQKVWSPGAGSMGLSL